MYGLGRVLGPAPSGPPCGEVRLETSQQRTRVDTTCHRLRVAITVRHLVELGQLGVLVLDGRTGPIVQRHGDQKARHVQLQQLLLLGHTQRGVDGEQIEVLEGGDGERRRQVTDDR
jgi:hypothetical protein